MLNSFWHSYWTFAISSFESCMIHTICEPEGTHAEVHQTISHIVLLFQIKKKCILLVLWHWPFSRKFFSVHYGTSKRWSPFTWPQLIIICWEYLISTAHVYKACKSEPILQMIEKKTQRNGSDPLIPINPALLQFILSIRGELMVFGWAHWNMSDSFHKD